MSIAREMIYSSVKVTKFESFFNVDDSEYPFYIEVAIAQRAGSVI